MGRVVLLALLSATAALAADPLQFERHRLERNPQCGESAENCAYVDLRWVELVSGPVGLRLRVNAAIVGMLGAAPEEIATEYLADYADEQKFVDDPEMRRVRWYHSEEVKVVRSTPSVLCFSRSQDDYSGGAHPNAEKMFLNLNAATGEKLTFDSILLPGTEPLLTEIAEPYFRKARNLTPTQDLKEAYFTWPDDRFHLNDNFALTETSLVFHYNTYEIASHADGPTEFEIPLAEIQGLLRPDFKK
jgi:hypothetical protein